MLKIWEGHITRDGDEMKNFSAEELTTKMINSVLEYNTLKMSIDEFNNYFRYPTFDESLAFELEIALMKHCCPMKRIKWEKNLRIPWFLYDVDNEPYSTKINSIMDDFVNLESKKCMKQILIRKDVNTIKLEASKHLHVYDYSIVDSQDQLDKYKSILFEETTHDFIKHYYREFLFYFPITLTEFEKTFFFFLTFLATKQYTAYTELNDIYAHIREINDILRGRYINIHNRLILSLIHLIKTDQELKKTSENIYEEIKDIYELTVSQFFQD